MNDFGIELAFGMMQPEPEDTVLCIQVGVNASVLLGVYPHVICGVESLHAVDRWDRFANRFSHDSRYAVAF